MNRLLLTTITALLFTAAAHAAPPPPQWLPQDSWPGGKRYDARLEQPVKLWATGLPAADLFASIAKQTGVSLAFSPPDDDNARICLNVYLNPKEPPTLRDLLVQLGWVMDCAWAVEGEGEARRYMLLHTSIGGGALERKRQEGRVASWRAQQEEAALQRHLQLRALARLRELADDLGLSRDEAIRRYRGIDDQKLIVLLDPVRRAFAHLLLASPEVLARFPDLGDGAALKWAQLTEEQRAYVREAVTADAARMESEQPESVLQIPWDDPVALAALDLTVGVGPAPECAGFACQVECRVHPDDPDDVSSQGTAGTTIQLASDPRLPGPTPGEIEAEVRQLLGEEGPPEESAESQQRREEEQRQEQLRRRAEPELARYGPTSVQTISLLSSLRLPPTPAEPYALWQLQEWVAAASGLHVISDHFHQPAQPLRRYVNLLNPAAASEVNALTALRFAALAWETLAQDIGVPCPGGSDAWEWGDAGSFLRFRSRNRDLWRAALLPRTAVATLDSWLEPCLPSHIEPAAALPEVEVPLDPLRLCRLLQALTYEQRRWGGYIAAGDPTDPAEVYRRTSREGVRATGESIPHGLLAPLDEEQMRLLRGEGLVVGRDIPPAGILSYYAAAPDGSGVEEGVVLRLTTEESKGEAGAGEPVRGYHVTAWDELRLVWPRGESAELGSIPRNLLLHPPRLPPPVPPLQ